MKSGSIASDSREATVWGTSETNMVFLFGVESGCVSLVGSKLGCVQGKTEIPCL